MQYPTVRRQKVGSESIPFTYHTCGSGFPEQGPQHHTKPVQGYLETPDEVDAGKGWGLGRPGMVGTNFCTFMVLLVFIWCVVSEEVGKGAIVLQEGRVVSHLRHLSVSKHDDKVRLGQKADTVGYQYPSLWRKQQALSYSILGHTPSTDTEPWGKHEES